MERDLTQNPWKGLASYTYQDADRFYGRDMELDEIANVIKQNAFTTLYGVSGAGKTSIINAGLFPILDKQGFLPIYIRFDHDEGHESYDNQIIKAVTKALQEIEAEKESLEGTQDIHSQLDELWLFFHSHRFWTKDNHIITPIIFIDQFEEIFTKNDEPNDIWAFFNIIDSLQYSTPTQRLLKIIDEANRFVQFGQEQNFRIVLTMREDFLPRLEDYSYNIPALRKNRIGLKPLNGNQALEVILKPCPEMVSRDVALHIISKVVGKPIPDDERKLEATLVDTSILSLFCSELYNYAVKDNNGVITIPLVDLYGGNILEWFYDRNMQNLPRKTYMRLENRLLTRSGFRNSVAQEDLLAEGILQEQLDKLAENRIIRIEEVDHNYRVEFTHDVLCKIAKKRRDEREKIKQGKDQDSAKRAFTIDNIILFTAFFIQFLAIYFGGFDKKVLLVLATLPFALILYLMIIHRTVADRNFSRVIWFIIGTIVIGILTVASANRCCEDLMISKELCDSITCGIASMIPFSIVLMPYMLLIVTKIHEKEGKLQLSSRHLRWLFLLVLVVQGIIIGVNISTIFSGDINPQRVILILLPSIVLALMPFYFLFRDLRNKTNNRVTICTCIYSLYVVFLFILFYKDIDNDIFSYEYSKSNEVAQVFMWVVIGILCAFYGIQYMKQPKELRLTDYWNNVLTLQSFVKYKSFKTRWVTIAVCFLILVFGVISTYYSDVIPFITLPVASLLSLHVACSEFKMTTAKKVFKPEVVIPLLVLSLAIVAIQYSNGRAKPWVIYVAVLLLTALCFFFLVHRENVRNRSYYYLRALLVSAFVGLALPVICIGYNIYNPKLFSVKRVWGGKISSDVHNLYFLTIEDREGKRGMMDNADIIVPTRFSDIDGICSIDNAIAKDLYPIRMWPISFFEVTDDGYKVYEDENANHNLIFSLNVWNQQKEGVLSGLDFLTYDNKIGRSFMKLWNEGNFNGTSNQENQFILSSKNRCISSEMRRKVTNRLYTNAIAMAVGESESYYSGYYSSMYDDRVAILQECYQSASLSPLKREKCFSVDELYRAAMIVDYLFACDESGKFTSSLSKLLSDAVGKDTTALDRTAIEDIAYFNLLSGKAQQAETFALSTIQKNAISPNAYSNYCISLYVNNKTNELRDALAKIKTSFNNEQQISFYLLVASKSYNLEQYKILKDRSELMNIIDTFVRLKGFSQDGIKVAVESSDANTMYQIAQDLVWNSYPDAATYCIDRAIYESPTDEGLYDLRGLILLERGFDSVALSTWNIIEKLSYEYSRNSSELYDSLIGKGLIERDNVEESYDESYEAPVEAVAEPVD